MDRAASVFSPADLPKMYVHTGRGLAYVRIEGRQIYLGKPGEPATGQKYRALLAEMLVHGTAPQNADPDGLTVQGLWDRFKEHADRRGGPNSYAKMGMTRLCLMYGSTRCADLGPRKVKLMFANLAQGDDYARSSLNKMLGAVKHVFKWGASEELFPVSVHLALATVAGLREGEAKREPAVRRAVSWETVEATAKHLPPTLAVAVKVLYHCGARPGELLTLQVGDVDRSGFVWVAAVEKHKTRAKGKLRNLAFGPKAQVLLAPMLLKPSDNYIFRTADVVAWRAAQCQVHRRENQKPDLRKTDRTLSEFVTADALANAVDLAIDLANAEPDRSKSDMRKTLARVPGCSNGTVGRDTDRFCSPRLCVRSGITTLPDAYQVHAVPFRSLVCISAGGRAPNPA